MKGSERLLIVLFAVIGIGAILFSAYLLFHEVFFSETDYESGTAKSTEKKEEEPPLPQTVKKALIHPKGTKGPLREAASARAEETNEGADPPNLIGVVVDRENKPVPKASIRLLHQDPFPFALDSSEEKGRTASDEWGAFFFSGVPPGEGFVLELIHPDFTPLQKGELEIPKEGVLDVGTLVLSRGGTLFGQITDGENRGVEGAWVFIREESEDGARFRFRPRSRFYSGDFKSENEVTPTCHSRENGDYMIAHVPLGKVVLLALSSGCSPGESVPVEVEEGTEKRLDIVLEPGLVLKGEVLNPLKEPVEGAEVSLLQSTTLPNSLKACTDESGKFSFADVGEGRASLLARADGFAPVRERVSVSKEEENFVTVTLEANGLVSGMVLEAYSGKPVPGAEVQAVSSSGFFTRIVEGEKKGLTDEAGRFKMENLSPGTYRLVAWSKGFAPASSEELEVAADRETTGVMIHLTQGGVIRGNVVDGTDYSPLQGAALALREPFRFDRNFFGRGGGEERMARGERGNSEERRGRGGLDSGGGNRGEGGGGRGRGGMDRGGRGGLEERGNRSDRPPMMPSRLSNLRDPFPIEEVHSGEDGSFSFTNVPEGEYYLEASLPEFCPFTSDPIQVHEGGVIENFQVVCFRGGIIKGAASDTRGLPLTQREVLISGTNSRTERVTTDERGEFVKDGLVSGEYRVRLVPKGESGRFAGFFSRFGNPDESSNPGTSTTAFVEAGKTTMVALVEEEGVSVWGIIKVNGKPERDLTVSASLSREGGGDSGGRPFFFGGGKTAITDSQGQYEFNDLLPGSYTITISTRDSRTTLHRGEMEVPKSQTVQRDFDLVAGSLTITVLAEDTHEPIPEITVMVDEKAPEGEEPRRRGRGFQGVQTDSKGLAKIPFIKPGEYSIRTWSSRFAPFSKDIAVRGGVNEEVLFLARRS